MDYVQRWTQVQKMNKISVHVHAPTCNSLNCYETYVSLSYEGPGSNIMSYEDWCVEDDESFSETISY